MEITEVRIKLMEESEDRLRAFCSITLDHCFVIRDLKIIEGGAGPFVAMPSRKLTARCPRCGYKNHLRCNFCNQCGARLKNSFEPREDDAPNKLYADIAHPINQQCRDLIQDAVIREYNEELKRAEEPDYVSRYDDEYDSDIRAEYESGGETKGPRSPESNVPKPHFEQKPKRESSGRRDDPDTFGAGILD